MRIVAAGNFAGEAGRAGDDAVDFRQTKIVGCAYFVFQREFQQTLVDAAQMGNGKVAVVNPEPEQVFGAARERIQNRRHDGIGNDNAIQQHGAGTVEKPAVVTGHSDGVIPFINE